MSFRIRPKGENEEEEEKKKGEPAGKTTSKLLTDSRTINTLPLHLAHHYSPHLELEFDVAVQDYCRNQTNQLKLAEYQAVPLGDKQANKRPAGSEVVCNSASVPASRVARSCKVVVCGDVAVGKTCLVNRFGHAIYSNTYQTTIGVDFDIQCYSILGQPYMLQIWDTAGLERFRCITSSYYRGCQAAIIVFDMSNMGSLANVVKWRDELLASFKTFDQLSEEHDEAADARLAGAYGVSRQPDEPLLFLVGTKCDLALTESCRAFMSEQANKLAALIEAELWFVSAQTGENVTELFNRIAALSFNRRVLNEIRQLRFDSSTMGVCLKEKLMAQQRELWNQSSKLIKITRRKDGDERRTRCVNVQCVIK